MATKKKTKKDEKPYVMVKCMSCGSKRKIYAGEVAKDDMPMCHSPGCCGMMTPCFAEVG